MGVVKKLQNTSLFNQIVNSNSCSNAIVARSREAITDALSDDCIKLRLNAVNTLRSLEDNHIRKEIEIRKMSDKTIENGEFISIEDVAKKIMNRE